MNFSVSLGKLVVPWTWICCARFCIIWLLDCVGVLAKGLLAVTTIERESKQKTAKGPRSVKEVDHGDPSCVAEDH